MESMKIAVLGWGSLIWDKRSLRINNDQWFEDGPLLPIEFARISNGGRLTLVIKPGTSEVPVLYAISEFTDLELARENLREREWTSDISNIGFFNFRTKAFSIKRLEKDIINTLMKWNTSKEFDAVIWTDLGPNFKNKLSLDLTATNAIAYLRSLDEEKQDKAKQYIVKAPKQIKTNLRSALESSF